MPVVYDFGTFQLLMTYLHNHVKRLFTSNTVLSINIMTNTQCQFHTEIFVHNARDWKVKASTIMYSYCLSYRKQMALDRIQLFSSGVFI